MITLTRRLKRRLALFLAVFCLTSVAVFSLHPAFGQQVAQRQVTSNSLWKEASFPVENFQAYTSGFGYRPNPLGSGEEFHAGLDIAAPLGSYIRNWWGGKVLVVSDDTGCGTMIVLQSGEWQHRYCHMQGGVEVIDGRRYLVDKAGSIAIAEGEDVPTGARIGRVGMTGWTTGPHLHWGLKYGGDWVDPAEVLRAMYAS